MLAVQEPTKFEHKTQVRQKSRPCRTAFVTLPSARYSATVCMKKELPVLHDGRFGVIAHCAFKCTAIMVRLVRLNASQKHFAATHRASLPNEGHERGSPTWRLSVTHVSHATLAARNIATVLPFGTVKLSGT